MTKKVDTWMPLLIDKYLGDTTHLTTELHGAYLLLLMTMWKREGVLPNDDAQLQPITRLTPAKWRASRGVLLAFFRVDEDGNLRQKRLSFELNNANKRSDAKAEAGAKGAAKRWQKDGSANGTAIDGDGRNDGRPDGTAIADGKQTEWQTGASISIPSSSLRSEELPYPSPTSEPGPGPEPGPERESVGRPHADHQPRAGRRRDAVDEEDLRRGLVVGRCLVDHGHQRLRLRLAGQRQRLQQPGQLEAEGANLMASPQLERLADSALLKLTSSAFALILCPALLWMGARLVDRLDRVESLLAEAKADKATTELRLKALESIEQEHGADLKRLGDKVLVHDFQLNDLQRGGKR